MKNMRHLIGSKAYDGRGFFSVRNFFNWNFHKWNVHITIPDELFMNEDALNGSKSFISATYE